MADIPPALKQADINIWKCAQKATQLQAVKPIIAYWCEYWVVNQILARQLHASDEEVLAYTTKLMDKLEQTKTEFLDEEAITDDLVGQAAVLSFAQETLDRAERVIKANKVSQQTATTFDAAATFFHLVNIWGTPDQETQQKIKYAKWNAGRILRAIKEGRDPNESNPRREELEQHAHEDTNNADGQLSDIPTHAVAPRPAWVEDITDADLRREAAGVSLPHAPVSAEEPVAGNELNLPGVPSHFSHAAAPSDLDAQPPLPSPLSPPTPQDPAKYYDRQPTPDLPSAPSSTQWAPTPPPPTEPTYFPPPATELREPWRPHRPPAEPSAPPTLATSPAPTAAVAPPPLATDPPIGMPSYASARPSIPYSSSNNSFAAPSAPVHAAPVSTVAAGIGAGAEQGYTVDEAAMANAQKHAKWAISALNFEDVPTAVRELRKALATLGAS